MRGPHRYRGLVEMNVTLVQRGVTMDFIGVSGRGGGEGGGEDRYEQAGFTDCVPEILLA